MTMNDLNQFASRYVQVWNETDAATRKKLIKELWSEEATHFTSTLVASGCEAIEARVAASHEKNVGVDGFIFKLSRDVDGHHDSVKLHWEMVPQAGGEAAAAGTVFIILDKEAKITADYQFSESEINNIK